MEISEKNKRRNFFAFLANSLHPWRLNKNFSPLRRREFRRVRKAKMKFKIMSNEIYKIPVKNIGGTETNLGEYKDKVLLVVNVASKCGLTPQYEGLQKFYKDYKDKGLEVLAFPANNFMGQEPGTNDEIKDFCSTNFNVEFPLFSKISVKGDDQHKLYKHLTETKPETDVNDGEFEAKLKSYGSTRSTPNEVLWNFEKFLISKDGEIAARFAPDVAPDDERLIERVEAELAK